MDCTPYPRANPCGLARAVADLLSDSPLLCGNSREFCWDFLPSMGLRSAWPFYRKGRLEGRACCRDGSCSPGDHVDRSGVRITRADRWAKDMSSTGMQFTQALSGKTDDACFLLL